jgi:ABC-type glycerol-3-phosphate transport system permease component
MMSASEKLEGLSATNANHKGGQIVTYVILCIIAILTLIPFAVMILTSFKAPQQLVNVLSFPSELYWQNYQYGLTQIWRGLMNSIFITFPAVAISIFVGSLAAYPLSQFRFKGDYLVYMLLLSGLFLPFQIVLIPMFKFLQQIALFDTIPGLWLIHVAYGIPMCTFFLRNFFALLPPSLIEAALIDGCSIAGYYHRILVPLAKPGLAALFILQFQSIWNDLLFGLSFAHGESVRPVTVGLASFVSQTDVQYGALMAATMVAILPMVIVFLLFQREFITGMLGGSVKG